MDEVIHVLGDGGVVVVLRVEGGGLVVVDAHGGERAADGEGLLQLQVGPLDVILGVCAVQESHHTGAKMEGVRITCQSELQGKQEPLHRSISLHPNP